MNTAVPPPNVGAVPFARTRRGILAFPALCFGGLLVAGGLTSYFLAVVARVFSVLLDPHDYCLVLIQGVVWYSGVPVAAGIALILADLLILLPRKRASRALWREQPSNLDLTVVLTAYNDAPSIGLAVDDFRLHPRVKRVVVVDNNSTDGTAELARLHGAVVVDELRPGYGNCVWRALREGSHYTDSELTLLCEGDLSFRAYDIEKFLAYIPHAEIVNGTRIVEQLRASRTQLTTFMYYGNFFTGKLLEAKHIGQGTFTDVGTTYKLCRNRTLERLLPVLNPKINLEFNAHFLDTALKYGIPIVECPVTFHSRVGVSKGGNASNLRAVKVGLRMIWGILFGWRGLDTKC